MRFSIFEYSQEKLVSLGLDVLDALILNWFSNFYAGKMEKRIFKDADGNGKVFGWVKISKVQEDLPVLGISSEKGIRKRFDNFVARGILERETLNCQNGKKSFYKTTDLYESLLNVIPKEQESLQRYSSSFAEETTIQNDKNIPQGTKTTFAKNDTSEKHSKSSQRYSSTSAERNLNTFAQSNFSSYALNDSLNKDSLNKDAADMLSLSDKFFGQNAFDSGFPEKAAAFLHVMNIQDKDSYFDFIKNKVSDKLKSQTAVINPRGLAYKLFFQTDVAQEYKDKEQQLIFQKNIEEERLKAEEKRKITCPVCGEQFLPDFINCPYCNFATVNFSKPKSIEIHKRFIKLPESKQKEYESKFIKILDLHDFKERSSEEKNKKRKQQEIQIQMLNSEYGLTD